MVAFSKLPVMMSYEDIIDKRYENGKIYFIKCKNDDGLIYVGSTIKTLNMRFSNHKCSKDVSLFKYVEDWDDWYIELYENYPCKNEYFLKQREDEIIKKFSTINKQRAFRNMDEWVKENQEHLKEYRERNRENKKAKQRETYALNRDKISKRRKELYDLNRENKLAKDREFYALNRDKISKRRKELREDNLERLKELYKLNCDKINKRRRELSYLKKQSV